VVKRKIVGIIIGFSGLCLLTLAGNKGISFDNLEYALWILVGTILYGVNVNLVSHYLKDINPIHLATVSLSFMVFPTAIILWQQDFFTLLSSFNLNLNEPSEIRWSIIASVLLGVVASAIVCIFSNLWYTFYCNYLGIYFRRKYYCLTNWLFRNNFKRSLPG
jgi:drug/metabolite transporter (DMT)-like permease